MALKEYTLVDKDGREFKIYTSPDLNVFSDYSELYSSVKNSRFDVMDISDVPEDTESPDERKRRIEREAGFETVRSLSNEDSQYYIKNKKCISCGGRIKRYSEGSWADHLVCNSCGTYHDILYPDPMGTIDHRPSIRIIKHL